MNGCRRALLLAWWLGLAAAVMVCPDAGARVRSVAAGSQPELADDEGLLLVAIDSSVDLDNVQVKKEGRLFGAAVLSNIKAGYSARLFIVPAGQYQWAQLRAFGRVRYDLRDDAEFRFQVRSGQVTYGGDLVFRPHDRFSADVRTSNRALRAIDWAEREHPGLLARHPLAYAGHYPDPFPAFLAAERAKLGARATPPPAASAKPPAVGPVPLPIEELWREERIGRVALNPAGTLFAEQVRHDKDWAVDLIDLAAGTSLRIMTTPFPLATMMWSGDSNLVLGVGSDRDEQTITVFRIGEVAHGRRTFAVTRFMRPGRVIQAAVGDPDHVLFASRGRSGRLLVHKVDISSQRALEQTSAFSNTPLNRGNRDAVAWFADGSGRLRAALARVDERYVLQHGAGEEFTEVLDMQAVGGFDPYSLSWDGDLIYGLSDEGRSQIDLVVFDPVLRRVTKTLFSKPGVDVVMPLLDDRRTPIGVAYHERGRLVSEYFDRNDQHLAELLRRTFAQRSVQTLARSRDRSQWILAVESSEQPARLYHLDVKQARASLLDDTRPWLDGKPLVAATRFTANSTDGLTVEAYLTLPPGPDPRPLVIMPHGGPIGVSDTLHFDPEVQFLASLGYAVLQVNYRGSGGQGKAFREAGHLAQGTLIEDDIDAALRTALERYPLDPRRMCMLGSSYGGYSALVSVLRWPDRFRCAVSIAGISDRLLVFTASDSGRSAQSRTELERIMGNPATQQEQLMAVSPLYHYHQLTTPLMLVHGVEDMRVDFEHARRLERMLALDGRAPILLSLADEGHGITGTDNRVSAWSGIAGFLRAHLQAAPAAAAARTGP